MGDRVAVGIVRTVEYLWIEQVVDLAPAARADTVIPLSRFRSRARRQCLQQKWPTPDFSAGAPRPAVTARRHAGQPALQASKTHPCALLQMPLTQNAYGRLQIDQRTATRSDLILEKLIWHRASGRNEQSRRPCMTTAGPHRSEALCRSRQPSKRSIADPAHSILRLLESVRKAAVR